MSTIFCVYNLRPGKSTNAYEDYVSHTKIPAIRGAPWCTGFDTWRIDSVLAPAVSEPEGALPSKPPYTYVAKIEVSDLDAMVQFLGTVEGQNFVKSWSGFIEPTAVFTMGYELPAL
jgi:hypothetical protein